MSDFDLYRLFHHRELKAIQGHHSRNSKMLTSILLFAIIVLMIAANCLEYLAQKVNDPFVHWVEVTVPWLRSSEIDEIEATLGSNEIRKRFHIQSLTPSTVFSLTISNPQSNQKLLAKASTIDQEDPMLSALMSEENLIVGGPFLGPCDRGLIVTNELLYTLGMNEEALMIGFKHCKTSLLDDIDSCYVIPIPIRAIVKSMPGRNKVLTTECFYQALSDPAFDAFDLKKQDEISLFLPVDEATALHCQIELSREINALKELKPHFPMLSMQSTKDFVCPGFTFSISFDPPAPSAQVHEKWVSALEQGLKKVYPGQTVERYYPFDFGHVQVDQAIPADAMSIHFDQLDSIRAFRSYLVDRFSDLDIDESRLRDKDNYKALFNMLRGINSLLIFFVVLSTSLFIVHIVRSHLLLIAMRLGTLVAFGMAPLEIANRYLWIVAEVYFRSCIIAVVVAATLRLVAEILCYRSIMPWSMSEFTNIILALTLSAIACLIFTFRFTRRLIMRPLGDLLAIGEM